MWLAMTERVCGFPCPDGLAMTNSSCGNPAGRSEVADEWSFELSCVPGGFLYGLGHRSIESAFSKALEEILVAKGGIDLGMT